MSNIFREMQKIRGEGHWMWINAHVLAVDCEVNEDVAASWLPAGLRLAKPARATIFVADYPETTFGEPYHEAGVFLHVKLGFSEAVHCAWMLVDDDVALILGREYMGFPKKLGEISLSVEGDNVRATVERKGTRLIDIRGNLGSDVADAPPMFARLIANVWSLLGLTVPKLLRFTPVEEVASARSAVLDIEVNGSTQDPLHELEVGRVLGACLYRTSFGEGKVPPIPVLPVRPMYTFRNWALRYG